VMSTRLPAAEKATTPGWPEWPVMTRVSEISV
jgi:hypothetical protein